MIREVKQINPNLPIIIITGFSTESSAIERSTLACRLSDEAVSGATVLAAAAKPSAPAA